MSSQENSNGLKKVADDWFAFAENRIKETGQKAILVVINDAENWLMRSYEKFKRNLSIKPKYKELQRYIEMNNETVQIGMDKKEIAVLWAMRNLGYTDEKIQEVLDLANKAYMPKEEVQK